MVTRLQRKAISLDQTMRDIQDRIPALQVVEFVRQFFRMKGVFDDLPSQDRLQINGNALAEGPVTGGGSDEMMRNVHRDMCPDPRSAPNLNFSSKSNVIN